MMSPLILDLKISTLMEKGLVPVKSFNQNVT